MFRRLCSSLDLFFVSSFALLLLVNMPLRLLGQGPKPIQILDQNGKETGIEYTVSETTVIPVDKEHKTPANLVTPISVMNTTKTEQRVIFCATGDSKPMAGEDFKHMTVEMSLGAADAKKNRDFTCAIPNAQKEKARTDRLGAMGCRLITIPAGGTAEAQFASGNDHTIPKFKGHLPLAGEFRTVGTCGGIGPVQTGKVGSGIANNGNCKEGWGPQGGHPPGAPYGKITTKLASLELQIIVLQDPKLGLAVSADKPRDKGQDFNCNKCFGMASAEAGGTGLDEFSGYHLEFPSAADRKNIKAIFVDHWINYKTLDLVKDKSKTLTMNLYDNATYFADTSTLVQYSIQQTYSSSGCTITHLSVPPDIPFLIAPQELAQLEVEITCNSSMPPDIIGYLLLTLRTADSLNGNILSQDFAWMAATSASYSSDEPSEGESSATLR